MTEKNLIDKYDQLRETLKEIDSNLKYLQDKNLIAQKDQVQKDIADVSDKLKNCDKIILGAKLSAMKGVLSSINSALKPMTNNNGWRLSLDQGTIIPNYLFLKLVNDLTYAFKTETGGYGVPYLFYGIKSEFDNTELKNMFTQIQTEFNNSQITDYPSLYEFHEHAIAQVIDLTSKYN